MKEEICAPCDNRAKNLRETREVLTCVEDAMSRVPSDAHAFSFVVGAYVAHDMWDVKTAPRFGPSFWKKMMKAEAHYSTIEEVRELSRNATKLAADVLLLIHLMVHERANKQNKCAPASSWTTIGECMTKDDLRVILGDVSLSNDAQEAIKQLKVARGLFIQNARTKKHMTLREAASFVGVDRSVIEGIEKGTAWVTGKARARLLGMNPHIRNANGALQTVETLIETLEAKVKEEEKAKEEERTQQTEAVAEPQEEIPEPPKEEAEPEQDALANLSDEELDALTSPQPVQAKVSEALPVEATIKSSKLREYNHQTPFGAALYMERTDRNMSAVEVGQLLGVSDNAVLRWESGINSPVHENYVKLCELFPAVRKAQLPNSKNAEKPVGNRKKEDMIPTTPVAPNPPVSTPSATEQPSTGGLKNLLTSVKMLVAVNASPDASAFKNLLRQAEKDNMSASEVLALLNMFG